MVDVMTTSNQVIYIHGKKKWRKNTALSDTKTNNEKGLSLIIRAMMIP